MARSLHGYSTFMSDSTMRAGQAVVECPKPSNEGKTSMRQWRMIAYTLAIAGCAGQAGAQELTGTLKNIKETGAITLGYRESSIPFSYLDDSQKPVGYAMDICYKIVDAVKKELKLDKLEVK